MQLRIEKIVYPGRPLARAEGKTIFTDEGLPGELVEVEILKEKKNYAEARTLRVIESAAERQIPVCNHYSACSPYQIMNYSLELKIKQEQLREIFSSVCGFHGPTIDFIPSPVIYGYRNKICLRFIWQAEKPCLAYHEPRSQLSFFPVDRCDLVSARVNAVISTFKVLLQGEPLTGLRHLEIRESFSRGELLLVFEADEAASLEKVPASWVPALRLEAPIAGAVGVLLKGRRRILQRLDGRDYIEEKIGRTIFRYGAGSFFQVNPVMLAKVVEKLQEHLQPHGPVKLIDLYAGLGTFGLLLADMASEIMAIEVDPNNIFFLEKNTRLNHIRHLKVVAGRSEDRVEDILAFKPGALVIDPPRRGMAAELVRALKACSPRLIFYLSCNPATLARDLRNLLDSY